MAFWNAFVHLTNFAADFAVFKKLSIFYHYRIICFSENKPISVILVSFDRFNRYIASDVDILFPVQTGRQL